MKNICTFGETKQKKYQITSDNKMSEINNAKCHMSI